jgi:hypothetical protein
MRVKKGRSRAGPMATQPQFDPEGTQATAMAPMQSKRTNNAKRAGTPTICQSKAEITRKASLRKQRQLQATNTYSGPSSQAGPKNARRGKA